MSADDVTIAEFERRLRDEVVDFQLARDLLDALESARKERDGLLTGERSDLELGLLSLVQTCHGAAQAGGWWNDIHTGQPIRRNVGELLCLIHSEISEAMEAHRKGLQDDNLPHRSGIEVELADAVIRIADLCGGLWLDLAGAVIEKMEYNAKRADHKPEARRAAGGKAY